jgi:hypothetical protein
MSGHQHRAQSHGASAAADYRLDQFAAAVADARATNPVVASLAAQEDQFISAAMDIGAHLDRQTLGAAWLIAGQLMGAHLQNTPPEQQAGALAMLLNVIKLAGEKLYTGNGLPITVACPYAYSGGAQCSTTRTAPNQERVDLLMRAHVAQNHPGEEWPPKPDVHERTLTAEDLGLHALPPAPEGWRDVTGVAAPRAWAEGRQYQLDEQPSETSAETAKLLELAETGQASGRCPECGHWIYLDSSALIGFHPVGDDGNQRTCAGAGKKPLGDDREASA